MGKKVGILSMQRVINYGSFLQAYALKCLIHREGVENVKFVDIEMGTPITGYTPVGLRKVVTKIRNIAETVLSGNIISKYRSRQFFKKVTKSIQNNWNILGIEANQNYSDSGDIFDYVVIGSDEVFNCCQESTWGFSSQLFGNVKNATHISSYAASFGQTTSENLHKHNLIGPIKNALTNLEYISVRDFNSESIVKEITDRKIYRHLDPVLIYGYIQELQQMVDSPYPGKYIIVYSYPERIKNKAEVSIIKEYAKRNGAKIISIFCTYSWCDMYMIPNNVLDILKWFKFADCVFTDTFHGTIFSIITHTKFYSLVRKTNKEKMFSLLKSLNLENRIIKDNGNITDNDDKIDFDKTEMILNFERVRTQDYLRRILNL